MLILRIPPSPGPDAALTIASAAGDPTSLGLSMRNPIAPGESPGAWIDGRPENVTHLIAWTGTLDDELFGRENPQTWLGPGREALLGFLAEIAPLLIERGAGLLLRPHCRHVLGDATTARSFLDTLDPNFPVGLALDPAAILEPEMCKAGADHCRRTFEILGPVSDLVILSGAEAVEGGVGPVPLGEGAIQGDLLVDLYRAHCRPETPVGLLDEDFDRQVTMLG